MSQTVSVDELKVGMYVHLDVGWMDHPFPRSSFRVGNIEQIRQIRQLGLQRLRWDPALSTIGSTSPAPAATDEANPDPSDDGAAPDGPDPQAAQREALRRQREADQLCHAQYEDAGRALDQAFSRVLAQPRAARGDIESLSRALRDKMLVDGELCIRMLNVAAGDRATTHPMNVAVVAMLLGRRLGLDGDEIARLGAGALLHDIGKLELPMALRKPDAQARAAEQAAYRSHVELGLRQARLMGADETALAIIAQHHEVADGSGFPRQLAGDAIAVAARIVSLVNRFDNLCNPQVLEQPMTPHEALSSLFAHHRGRFDAGVLHAFIRMMGVYPAGSLVQLSDDRYGMVVSVDPDRPLKPQVLVHDPAVARDDALYLDLQRAGDLAIRRSLRATQLPPPVLAYLSPGERVTYFFEPRPALSALAEAAVS